MSGWFEDKALSLKPYLLQTGALALPLASFVDARQDDFPESASVLVRVGDLYLQYNKAKGYNIETFDDQKDRVTVVLAQSEEHVSDLVAALLPTERYEHANFDGNGNSLIIEACYFLSV